MKNLNLFILTLLLCFTNSVFGQQMEIYVSGATNDAIIKYDENGENHEVFIAPNSGGLDWPQDIVFLEDQDLVLVSSLNTGDIKKYHSETGEHLGVFADLGGNVGPTRMEIGDDGYLYVIQWGGYGDNLNVLRYNLDGTLHDEFTMVGMPTCIGMDWDADGNLYVSSYSASNIRKYGPNGEDLGLIITTNLNGPTNLWVDDEGFIYVLNWNSGNVVYFNAAGEYQDFFIQNLSNPEGIAFLNDGTILIGDGGSNTVQQFTSEGVFIENYIDGNTTELNFPNAVVLREVDLVAVNEVIIIDKDFAQPSIGTAFYLSSDFEGQIEEVQVYSSAGKLVENYAGSKSILWDAVDASPGIYVIQLRLKDGVVYSQQVAVQR